MREIGVCVGFMNGSYRRTITEAAARLGFSVTFHDSEKGLAGEIEQYEVLFGHPAPDLLKKADKLRWLCSDFAGVEKYLPEEIWPRPDCLLSNASGAYGTTISEHIVMVLLMLLRRMPEYQQALSRREWPCFSPIRSIAGSHMALLGTGDIGTQTARRLKALGAGVTGVCRTGRAEDPAFDLVLPVEELDRVLPEADALIMALPATAETEGILSRQRIGLLPERALVVNVGRGSAIDQEALVEALQTGQIGRAHV